MRAGPRQSEPVLDPLVEVEPDLAVAIVLDDDSPPAVHRPLVFRRELKTGIIGQCRRRAGQRRPAPGNHGLQKAPTLQRMLWLVHRAAGPQPKRCCRTGQESSRDDSKRVDNWHRRGPSRTAQEPAAIQVSPFVE
jgi:hypothetical protein